MRQAFCQKCKWYNEQDEESGMCILNPPTPVPVISQKDGSITTEVEYVLPIVPKDWRCGKFDAR